MKKKNLYLIILLGVVGLLFPKNTLALDISYLENIDYRFFVEDKDKNIVEGLKFKLHDINNIISFESTYDSNNKTYYFSSERPKILRTEDFAELPKLPNSLLPEGLVSDLENIRYNSYDEYYESVSNIVRKYPSVDLFQNTLLVTIPMILEETSGKYEVPIKKIIFVELNIQPYLYNYNNIMFCNFIILNNDCTLLSETPIYDNDQKQYYKYLFERLIMTTRKNAYDYSDEVLNKFSRGNFTSPEVNSNNYKNRCSNRIASAEIASEEINVNLTQEGRQEQTLADYCECLPVFTQERKVTINPATWNTGLVALILSMVIVTGGSLLLIKKKS